MTVDTLNNVDMVLTNLPQSSEEWKAQIRAGQAEYEQLCASEGRDFNPFKDNLFQKPRIPFSPYFINLAQINYGGNAKGAWYLYQVLSQIPEGYLYHGKVLDEDVSKYEFLGVITVGNETHDGDGNLLKGFVNIAVLKSSLDRARS